MREDDLSMSRSSRRLASSLTAASLIAHWLLMLPYLRLRRKMCRRVSHSELLLLQGGAFLVPRRLGDRPSCVCSRYCRVQLQTVVLCVSMRPLVVVFCIIIGADLSLKRNIERQQYISTAFDEA